MNKDTQGARATNTSVLPIQGVIPEIRQYFLTAHELVLEAPPGAGKTTVVPLSLLDEAWLQGKKIVMLEPRRIAARAAASRMAQLLGEPVGKRVGYQVRHDKKISRETKIEVITEGVLTRRLQSDPSLENVALLIFDEFHERNLESDLGLALALQGRELFRESDEPLKILVMSATLDGGAISKLLSVGSDGARIIRSEGRAFPVEAIYGKTIPLRDSIVGSIVQVIESSLELDSKSILVFLPGQKEILAVQKQLLLRLGANSKKVVSVLPLYGSLSMEQQQRAIAPLTPSDEGQIPLKVVLSTDLAETSLTIEGVSVVIDSGLRREPAFDANSGMTRLNTRRISKASSTQRMGRAGRLEPGKCYRMWSEDQQNQLIEYSAPEILQADLAPLALNLLSWGVESPEDLAWLNKPPSGAYGQALSLLRKLGVLDPSGESLSEHGKAISGIPAHPRIAHMLVCSMQVGQLEMGAALAAILSERLPSLGRGVDLSFYVSVVVGEIPCDRPHRAWLTRMQRSSKLFTGLLSSYVERQISKNELDDDQTIGYLIACAYPDRIAHRKASSDTRFQLSSGRSVQLDKSDDLASSEWLAVAELGGNSRIGTTKRDDRIFQASKLDSELFESHLAHLKDINEIVEWSEQWGRFVAEERVVLGEIVLSREKLTRVPDSAKRDILCKMIRKQGLGVLSWSAELEQWRARVILVQLTDQNQAWPNMSDTSLLQTLEYWLSPHLSDVSSIADLKKIDLKQVLSNELSWPLSQELERLAPQKIKVPSGSQIAIDYLQSPPVLAVKLQEMFGSEQAPAILNGALKLVVHLLSPARRPIQVTQDLLGFWRGSYHEVKKEMKGRYPKHPWPDNPIEASPSKFTKARS